MFFDPFIYAQLSTTHRALLKLSPQWVIGTLNTGYEQRFSDSNPVAKHLSMLIAYLILLGIRSSRSLLINNTSSLRTDNNNALWGAA